MKLTKRHMTKGFTLVELLVVIAIIAALAAMATPVIMKQNKKAAMTEATSNAKQIFYLMIEFDQDFGTFPSTATKDEIEAGDVPLGTASSNDYFNQFVAGGYTQSEEIFYAKSKDSKKPNNALAADSLNSGECGFAYLAEQSTSDNSGRPLVMAPMNDGAATFDPDPYDNKCVVLRIDGAVKQLRIKKDKTAILNGTTTLFSTGDDTVWGDDDGGGSPTDELKHPTSK